MRQARAEPMSQEALQQTNYDCFLESPHLEDVTSLRTVRDAFPSAPHTPVRLVLRARQGEKQMLAQQAPKKLPRERANEVDFRKDEEDESLSFSLPHTMAK